MFDIGYTELIFIAVVALLVIGPKDLPKALNVVGKWVGKGRAMSRHLRSGLDEMMRQAELEEMEKQWRAHNAEIMAAAPVAADFDLRGSPGEPATEPEPPVAADPLQATLASDPEPKQTPEA